MTQLGPLTNRIPSVQNSLMTQRPVHLPLMSRHDGWSARASTNQFGSYLELLSRIAAALVLTTSAGTTLDVRYPRSGGAGTFRSLHQVLSLSSNVSPAARTLCSLIVETWSRPHTIGYVDALEERNTISHGGLPTQDKEAVDRWRNSAQAATDALTKFIADSGGLHVSNNVMHIGSTPIWPLLIPSGETALLFHSWRNGKPPSYILVGAAAPPVELPDESATSVLRNLLEAPRSQRYQQLHLLIQSIKSDIEGLTADDTNATFEYLRDGQISLEWTQRTSSNDVPRSEVFRVAADNQRQWRDPRNEWVSYSAFIRDIVNWGVVVRRLHTRFDKIYDDDHIEAQRIASESKMLQIPNDIRTKFRPQVLLGADIAEGIDDTTDLSKALDDAARSTAGLPQVFFLTGEAGIGKTYNLLEMTKARHQAVSNDNNIDVPIFLYISCAGRSLQTFAEIVNSEVVNTQNLNFDSVLALCRNGLLVVVIDGFDELIEGAGYNDAYKVLAPTIERLGDRGVLIVSARSSYLANQYRSSLRKREHAVGYTSARHTVLELERWTPTEVDSLFKANPHWRKLRPLLTKEDLALLGVPFFSRMFNSYAATIKTAPATIDLHAVLIDGYLDREIGKLEPSTKDEITTDILHTVFREIAGLIYESTSASVTQVEFEDAASYALGIELSDSRHRALAARMSVLCGLSVTGEQGSIGFRFEHDLFYESFLASYIVQQFFESTNYSRCADFLNRGALGDKTIEDLVANHRPEVLHTLEAAVARCVVDSYLRQNCSALAGHLLSSGESRHIAVIESCDLQEVRVSPDTADTSISLVNCKLAAVHTPMRAHISLSECSIGQLQISAISAVSSTLSIDGSTSIDELVITSDGSGVRYFATQRHIWPELDRLGVTGAQDRIVENVASSSRSPIEEFAEAALTRMLQREEYFFVVQKSNRIPGENTPKGLYKPKSQEWAAITSAALDSEVANSKPLNASGPAKLVVTFNYPLNVILRGRHQEDVRRFWEKLTAKP